MKNRRSAAGPLLAAIIVVAGVACSPAGTPTRVVPSYDTYTSRLVQLSADLNGDGRADQWTYMDGNRPIRGEGDADGDGRVDRWEYFDAQATLVRVGSSSRGDGVEDTWISPTSSTGESQVARSRHRDRTIDRREVVREGVLLRAEDDTNADGRPDKWDIYEDGVLREARFDTSLARGRADRRLLYDGRGQLTLIEADDDGDGRFERLATPSGGDVTRPAPSGAKR